MNNRENESKTGSNFSLTRRAFLKLVWPAAVVIGSVVGFGGIVRLIWQKDRFVRPPGAATEGEFLSLCIKCQRCQQICPMGIITPVTLAENVANAGTPKLNFTLGYCDLCMKCPEVCPTGALQPIEEEMVRLGLAQIDKEKCIAWAWGGCTECYDECPLEAITLDDMGRPIVNDSICNGCGLCEYICPVSALRRYTGVSGRGITVVPVDIKQESERL